VRTLQIQHDNTNLLGSFHDVFHGAGEVDVWRTFEDPAPESLAPYDAVVLMGGVAMPDEDDRYPWIPQELRLLREGLERDLPMLGVCFGGQILARAAGAGSDGRHHLVTGDEIQLLPGVQRPIDADRLARDIARELVTSQK
jgi:GMP synthase-like glutamine amidotransferase